ncbi:TolC family protein, partial [Streptococcus suis]
QQIYGELGLARADVLDAVQVANPRISLSSLALAGGPGSQFVFGVAEPLVDLLTLPAKARLARLDYERARYEVAASILGVSLDVEAAWYRYVGAQQVAEMRAAVADGLQVSADLAQRFYDAGNITELQLNREKAAASQARIE